MKRRALPARAAGDFFGVIVFIVIAIVSLLSKMQEAKKKKDGDWSKPDATPSIEPEDLPEPIRRMLYGDQDQPIRTAKPRSPAAMQQEPQDEGPVVTVRTAQPQQQQRSFGTVPGQRSQSQPRPDEDAKSAPVKRTIQATVVRKVVVQRSTPVAKTPAPVVEEPRKHVDIPIPKPTVPKLVKAKVPPPPKPQIPKPLKPVEPEALIKAAFASDEVVKPLANPWRFKDARDLQRAIVLSELLAPPLALRE